MKKFVTAAGVIGTLLGCSSPSDEPRTTIKLAAVLDRTGNNSEPSWGDAISLAQEQVNAGLALAEHKNFRFEFLNADSANEPTVAVPRAAELIRSGGAKGLIIDTTQNTVAANRTNYDDDGANDLSVPITCGSCTSSAINNPDATNPDASTQEAYRNGKGWQFRAIMSSRPESLVMMRAILQAGNNGDVNGDGQFKLAIYHSDEGFGSGAANELKAYAEQSHPTPAPIVEIIKHPRNADPNTYEWGADLAKLTDNRNENDSGTVDGFPDAIAVVTFAQPHGAFVKAYKQAGHTIPVLHYQAFRINSVIQSLGSLAEGEEGVSHARLDGSASGNQFANAFQAEFGIAPPYRASTYYDAATTMMLAAVIASSSLEDPSQVTPEQIRDAMRKTSDLEGEVVRTGPEEFARAVSLIAAGKAINYEGASGPMDFDANGNVLDRVAHFKVQGGAFVEVALFDCIKDVNECPLME